MIRRHHVAALGAAAAAWLLLASPAPARAADSLELHNAVFQDVEVTGPDGTTHRERKPATKVVPGTEVVYEITYKNIGKQPAADVVITNPVPKEVAYQPDLGPGPAIAPEVSVDSGRTWGPLASLSVKGTDGKPRPAQGKDVTHVRWKLHQPLRAGEQGTVSFRAVLN